ncbi:Holliday junction resolvase RecU [Virgibacillus profundi]|uniref:Holliday junction resolvase RecU n=1 Tax=Virgibacillus profundi TaxID=2024555 RepID=A0A2A2IE99_9BACI|nr:Holliday junction resolvase RecU [Virgibacillus profundi]PAV29465.1 Holliday junction resolvase RecU [Virgibacillus profundi]PXY53634.1 Holliday junction resolvase RecU [Virgibacillus profundi]
MNYPNGKKKETGSSGMAAKTNKIFSNRGMSLEEDINTTNQYYLDTDKAIIHKKPTPVQIVKVNYPRRSAAVITEAYFKQASTTDYNGLYRNSYIDFEAKETKNKTLFPLANIHDHQIRHMEAIVKHGGISFLIIRFAVYDETFFMPAEKLFTHWYDKLNGGKKSIAYKKIKDEEYLIPFQYQARIDYLKIIDKLYF